MRRFTMLAVGLLVLVAVACGSGSGTQSSRSTDWPNEHRWRVNSEVEALFAYEMPLGDWAAAIFMEHSPTKAWVHLTADARISNHKSVSRDAMIAVCAILDDEAVVTELTARAAERNPYPAFIARAIEGDSCEAYR
jgi:hypothetical protein